MKDIFLTATNSHWSTKFDFLVKYKMKRVSFHTCMITKQKSLSSKNNISKALFFLST